MEIVVRAFRPDPSASSAPQSVRHSPPEIAPIGFIAYGEALPAVWGCSVLERPAQNTMKKDKGIVMKNKPIEQIPCGNCHLLAPAWRKCCIHCNSPLVNAPVRPPLNRQSEEAPAEH